MTNLVTKKAILSYNLSQTYYAKVYANVMPLVAGGGEELIIALANCDAKSAFVIANKIRKLAAEKLAIGKNVSAPITISIGLAEYGLNETSDQLFSRADEALCRAKNNGRNQVVKALGAVHL